MQIGLCYQGPSTAIANPGWTIGEPIQTPSVCNPASGQVLSWTMSGANTISGANGLGYLEGFSDHLYITYEVLVGAAIPQGTNLTNGVQVSTTNVEDDLTNNTDDETVSTPFPDPTVSITGPASVLPGDVYQYYMVYQNNNRACANNTYVIQSMPDVFPTGTPDGNSDISLSSISVNTGTVYVHTTGSLAGSTPSFDPLNPTGNGWQTRSSTGTFNPVNYIAILNPYLCQSD